MRMNEKGGAKIEPAKTVCQHRKQSTLMYRFRLWPSAALQTMKKSTLQTVLRQTEGAAKAEAVAHISMLESQAAAAAKEKALADATLEETREHLNASRAQVRLHCP